MADGSRSSRGPCNFRKRDVQVAVEAVRAAGCDVVRAEIDPHSGKIVIVTAKPREPDDEDKGGNEWDRI